MKSEDNGAAEEEARARVNVFLSDEKVVEVECESDVWFSGGGGLWSTWAIWWSACPVSTRRRYLGLGRYFLFPCELAKERPIRLKLNRIEIRGRRRKVEKCSVKYMIYSFLNEANDVD